MTEIQLDPRVVDVMRRGLPAVAEAAVAAIIADVPSYAGALSGQMGENIRGAVQLALGGFINLAVASTQVDPRQPTGPAREGAYLLGRGEARSGRSMEALLAAYRVGSRESWRQLARFLVDQGVDAATIAAFAELVFAYMDQLSDASVSGHSDEMASSGRVRQQHLDELARALLDGVAEEALVAAATRAQWEPPRTLTAVLMPDSQAGGVMRVAAQQTLRIEDPTGEEGRVVLLVPDAPRALLLRTLQGPRAAVGPARPWTEARLSWERARRALALPEGPSTAAPLDTEAHLAALVVHSDAAALADLRVQVLAPLDHLTPGSRAKLSETLRAWLLHRGRREAVAEALFVHPQTVRYRVGQLREAYGELLDDPDFVRDATIALGGSAGG